MGNNIRYCIGLDPYALKNRKESEAVVIKRKKNKYSKPVIILHSQPKR